MYREYFGLKDLPFSIAPDPYCLYLSHQHREALAHLVYGIKSDGGFVLLTGEVGTGKTTICRCLLEQLPENTDVAFMLNPKLTVEELLAVFCDELGIRYPEGNRSIKVFIDQINAYLLASYARGRKTVLILEEAQNLSADVLEQIRLLTNLETNQRKLLQIIMLGQPELLDMLSRLELRQLAQRITARYHLRPLSKEDVVVYVKHRLALAGARSPLFSSSAIDRLFRLSKGIPRLINILCDRALLGAYVKGRNRVDKKTLVRAAREVFGEVNSAALHRKKMRWAVAGLLFAGLFAALAGAYYNHRPQPEAIKVQPPPAPAIALEAPKLDALEWPAGEPRERSKTTAYQALFKEWDISLKLPEDGDACNQAEAYGLRCLSGQGSLSELISLNRPAVLKLYDEHGKEFYATLTAIGPEIAVFVVGSGNRTVNVKELEQRWLGDYTLLWRLPPNYHSSIHPGAEGPEVKWLEEQMAFIQDRAVRKLKTPVFDENLVREVKKFQFAKSLVPDGIVGPQTIIRLNTEAGSEEPLLTEEEGG